MNVSGKSRTSRVPGPVCRHGRRRRRPRQLSGQRSAGERRGHAAAVDPQEHLVEPADEPAPRPASSTRGPGRQPSRPIRGDVAEDAVAQRQAVLLVILVQELGLEPGHVDVGRALALARLALEAEVEHLVQRGVGEPLKAELAGDRQPQRIGAAAGAVALVAGRLVRGAHRPRARLAALADPRAQLGGRQQAPFGREVEGRRHLRGHVRRADSAGSPPAAAHRRSCPG